MLKAIRRVSTPLLGLLALALTVSMLSGCGVVQGMFMVFRRPGPTPGDGLNPISPNPDGTPVQVTLYFADAMAEFLVPEERTVIQRGESTGELAVWELIKGPAREGHFRTVPKETRLLSLQVVDEVAYVNFSREVQTKHSGGTTGEMFTVQSVTNTLAANNKDIKSVQFLVEGKVEEAIWGHGITSEPIAPNREMIR